MKKMGAKWSVFMGLGTDGTNMKNVTKGGFRKSDK